MAELEAVESVAAHCEDTSCDPRRTGRGTLAAPAPPFLAAMILNSRPKATEDWRVAAGPDGTTGP